MIVNSIDYCNKSQIFFFKETKKEQIALFYFQNVKKTVLSTPATPTKHKIFQSPKVVKGILVSQIDIHLKL